MNHQTERDTTTPRTLLTLALAHLRRLKAWEAAYEQEVDDWYRSGPGRSPRWREEPVIDGETGEFVGIDRWNAGGNGYTFPACIHGMSRWTDYDNICGGCEDGRTVYELALACAWSDFHKFTKRQNATLALADQSPPHEVMGILLGWACEALQILETHPRPDVRPLP